MGDKKLLHTGVRISESESVSTPVGFRRLRDDEITTGLGLPKGGTTRTYGLVPVYDDKGRLKTKRSYRIERTSKGGRRVKMNKAAFSYEHHEKLSDNKTAVRQETDDLVRKYLESGGTITLCNDAKAKGI